MVVVFGQLLEEVASDQKKYESGGIFCFFFSQSFTFRVLCAIELNFLSNFIHSYRATDSLVTSPFITEWEETLPDDLRFALRFERMILEDLKKKLSNMDVG